MRLTSLDQIDQNYRHIYLQPHFDDGVLSCGGAIAMQTHTGQRVLVVTVFGGVPAADFKPSAFASQTQQMMGLPTNAAEAVEQRRAEDEAAIGSLEADVLWLDQLDAMYRGTPALYQGNEALFGAVNPGDLSLDETLSALFANIHERAPLAAIYAPLGIGHHVDHQLCCSAADRLAQRKLNVKFYEDFPYVAQPNALETRQRELAISMEPELVEISGQLRQKEEALAMYTSQITQLFGTEDKMRQQLRSYSGSLRRAYPGIYIERYWRW